MIVRSEYSYRQCFGPIPEVVARLPATGGVIADSGCWGHVPFAQECKKQGKRAVLGCRFTHNGAALIVVPKSPAGLRSMYEAVREGGDPAKRAPDEDWYTIVMGPSDVPGALQAYAPGVSAPGRAYTIASGDNLYPSPQDKQAWLLMLGRFARQRGGPLHILSPAELVLEGGKPEWITELNRILETCDTPLPRAENVKFKVAHPHEELCALVRAELVKRGLDHEPYKTRLEYELKLILEKKFSDYFLVIWDMIRFAKEHMLVGPARGSSAGSLVCWLTRITEIDPIRHGLIFERFIDLNRFDLPDIDIDFPDERRHLVMEYLREKYGEQNVANIGTVIRYKPKSALTDVAKQAKIPLWELDKLKDVMIERSSGDMRAGSCLADSLDGMEVGRALVEKYPLLRVASRLENHARTAGMHAAGWIVCNEPVWHFCGVNKEGSAQIDKKMAETINMLKIDALGLRTLSIIEETCSLAGVDRDMMYTLSLDDDKAREAFALINRKSYSGIFQFEGLALQSVAKQVVIDRFDDIAAITALARPGPLSGGETARWIVGKNTQKWSPLHPALEPYTKDTFGTVIYQEQVMRMTREIGNFSWADTARIRKLMSASIGDEAFNKFREQFVEGAQSHGIALPDAHRIWKAFNTFGSWSFNLSHAVAYGLVSYWTAWLKAQHPLEFAVANLRHAKDDDGAMAMLREMHRENSSLHFTPVDAMRSTHQWEFADGELLGPLTGLIGVGLKTANDIQSRRTNKLPFTARQVKLLGGKSKFADHSPAHSIFGDWYDNPRKHFKNTTHVDEIADVDTGDQYKSFTVIGKLLKKDLRDKNLEKYSQKRGGKLLPEELRYIVLFHIEDDSGRVICCISSKKFQELGKPIIEGAGIGQWFAIRGRVPSDFKLLLVEAIKWLTIPGTEEKKIA